MSHQKGGPQALLGMSESSWGVSPALSPLTFFFQHHSRQSLMATCPRPPRGSRCCAQGLVSSCPHSCPDATFLVPGCCWVGLWGSTGPRLQLCRALGPLLLYRQPLPQVSTPPPRNRCLQTAASIPATDMPGPPGGEISRAPLHVQGRSSPSSAWTQLHQQPCGKTQQALVDLPLTLWDRRWERWKNKFLNPDCDGGTPTATADVGK